MMKGSRATVLTFAEKCKTILSSNWQGTLNTVKADAKGSKEEIYSSKVKYFVKKGRPYIWVPEGDLHNVVKTAAESLREAIISEGEAIKKFSYSVSGILCSSNFSSTSHGENLQELLDEDQQYMIYKFDISSITYIEGKGSSHEVDLKDMEESKADPLSLFSASLIDGINQSEARRRALMILCATYLNKNVKDVVVVSIDRKGVDLLGKVVGPMTDVGSRECEWKELRLVLTEEAGDVETFCRRLVEMEKKALKNVAEFSGLPSNPIATDRPELDV
ncbi:uncharacterized protein LOC112519361 isoform X3 [Cynara cardunculus var. scolymus]|uniref:uncharacterized protein LOC112519361 isoform X3 n=1 Tax=Cynara cardunculus var. scolymus TaxID=59895 RepID=UPI000D626DD3|nr:uncharacterized protein LOC112519361 isoform X3 [Cynara cardunculus var. scolymus]